MGRKHLRYMIRMLSFGLLLALVSGPGCRKDSASPYERILLNRFPVSLDFLFKTDNPTRRSQLLTQIKSGHPELTSLFLVPYPNYHHSSHFPATFKWYLYTGGHTPVSIPLKSYLELRDDVGKPTKSIDGMTCLVDVTATLHLSYYIRVVLGHVCIDQNLASRFHSAGEIDVFGKSRRAVEVPAETVVGYTHQSYALDFIVEDDTQFNLDPLKPESYLQHWVNPFFYFSAAALNQIRSYYQAQLDAMKVSGLYPESRLDRIYDINESAAFFGTWFYQQGYFQLNASHHPYGWYSFDGCILNILNVAKTDRDTFWKNANTGTAFSTDMIGVFCDAFYPGEVTDYQVIGGKYMYRIEGDNREGIVRLDNFFSNSRTGPLYLKYQLEERGTTTIWDDLLHVDYFPSTAAARGPFSARKLTYIRMLERTD